MEVGRWSNSGHDIIIISKEMCNMMIDMSNFTKYVELREKGYTQFHCC